MNIVEAMMASKDHPDHPSFSRRSGGGYIRWDLDWTYRVDAEDLIADDWECDTPKCVNFPDGEPQPHEQSLAASDREKGS